MNVTARLQNKIIAKIQGTAGSFNLFSNLNILKDLSYIYKPYLWDMLSQEIIGLATS